jgi:hypothetical protein
MKSNRLESASAFTANCAKTGFLANAAMDWPGSWLWTFMFDFHQLYSFSTCLASLAKQIGTLKAKTLSLRFARENFPGIEGAIFLARRFFGRGMLLSARLSIACYRAKSLARAGYKLLGSSPGGPRKSFQFHWRNFSRQRHEVTS